jgi:hypothetical protein
MRQERTVQATIFEVFARHEIGCLSSAQRSTVSAGSPRRPVSRSPWRRKSPATRLMSYEELALHIEDSASFRAFARLPLAWSPKKSVLHQTISAIRSETWEARDRLRQTRTPNRYEIEFRFGSPGDHTIYAVRANELGSILTNYYSEVVEKLEKTGLSEAKLTELGLFYLPITMKELPRGLFPLDMVNALLPIEYRPPVLEPRANGRAREQQ